MYEAKLNEASLRLSFFSSTEFDYTSAISLFFTILGKQTIRGFYWTRITCRLTTGEVEGRLDFSVL